MSPHFPNMKEVSSDLYVGSFIWDDAGRKKPYDIYLKANKKIWYLVRNRGWGPQLRKPVFVGRQGNLNDDLWAIVNPMIDAYLNDPSVSPAAR